MNPRLELGHLDAPLFSDLVISTEIAAGDDMYVRGQEAHYFGVCRSALENIVHALALAKRGTVGRILDLPCGHGRVLRGLRALFPTAEIVACDLQRPGVDFCATKFGAVPVYSEKDPANIPIPGAFDLIWVGSLFTHLDEQKWNSFLDFFLRHLLEGGVLVFTFHGRHAARQVIRKTQTYALGEDQLAALMSGAEQTGFGFQEQTPGSEYGVSMSSPEWVLRWLAARADIKVHLVREMGWDNHQDVVAISRTSDLFVPRPMPSGIETNVSAELPLRYRMADSLNHGFKRFPLIYSLLKAAAAGRPRK